MQKTLTAIHEATIAYVAVGSRHPGLAWGVTTLAALFAAGTVLTGRMDFTTLTANAFALSWSSAEWTKRRRMLASDRDEFARSSGMVESLTDADKQTFPQIAAAIAEADTVEPYPPDFVPLSIDLYCNGADEPAISVVNGNVMQSTWVQPGYLPEALELHLDSEIALAVIGKRVILNRLVNLTGMNGWPLDRNLTTLVSSWIGGRRDE
ncbi:MAG: hypothetical protein AAF704_13055 [Cyanobacteria bacterium P01_D01_bin.123]